MFDVVSGTFFLALWSFPIILAGVLAIGFLANSQYVKMFPAAGLHDVLADSMTFLPVATRTARFSAAGCSIRCGTCACRSSA
jgi:ABC-type microcin C transport system permease subunit YejB